MFGIIAAVLYFGAAGAILSVGLFVVAALIVKVSGLPLFGLLFAGALKKLIMRRRISISGE